MIRGLYSAAGGMLATSQQQDVAAQNLAHANKPGYRRDVLRFESVGTVAEFAAPQTQVHPDFTPGGLEHTGNPLDVAIAGPGFFVVKGPNGPLYSRCGVFQLNGAGELVTPEGFAVQGMAGTIGVPANAGSIEIVADGTVLADGNEIDQLRVVTFADPRKLQRAGTCSFTAPDGSETVSTQHEIRQGVREQSNTSSIQEMLQMTAGLRQFEATQRALRAIGDAVALTTRPLGR